MAALSTKLFLFRKQRNDSKQVFEPLTSGDLIATFPTYPQPKSLTTFNGTVYPQKELIYPQNELVERLKELFQ